MNIIEIKDLGKVYRKKNIERKILENINLKFQEKNFYIIMGASGCGKTTLLNILNGIDKDYIGTYKFNNKDVRMYKENERNELRGLHISYIHQEYLLIEHLNLLDNIKLKLSCQNKYLKVKLSKKEIMKKSVDVIEKLGLTEYKKHYPKELSGGQKQRIAIARAIVGDPQVILLDEPTGALDKEKTIEIMEILKEINKEGKTIIMVTHDESLKRYATDIINL